MTVRRPHQPLPPSAGSLTRRAALTRLGAAGAGALLAVPVGRIAAQDATPGSTDLPPVVAEYIAAFEAFDLDRIIAIHTEDATFEEVPTGTIREGRDAIRAHLAAFTSAFSDLTVDYTSAFASGTWAAGEWVVRGRYTGTLEGLPPGEGQEVSVRGVDIFELEGAFVRHVREYADFLALLMQVGAFGEGDAEAATPAG